MNEQSCWWLGLWLNDDDDDDDDVMMICSCLGTIRFVLAATNMPICQYFGAMTLVYTNDQALATSCMCCTISLILLFIVCQPFGPTLTSDQLASDLESKLFAIWNLDSFQITKLLYIVGMHRSINTDAFMLTLFPHYLKWYVRQIIYFCLCIITIGLIFLYAYIFHKPAIFELVLIKVTYQG